MIIIDAYERLCTLIPDYTIVERNDMPCGLSGLYLERQKVILLKDKLPFKKRVEILSEEIGHYYTSAGDITDYKNNAKQEVIARKKGYELIINFDSLIFAWKDGIHNLYSMSSYFDVTEEFVLKALEHLKQKYGLVVMHRNYRILLDPLNITEYHEVN
ncbi:ImmA/IrrE family metallo-endopeptidase [Macrococcus caseolyticus]|uniref:ImmA/IrrE family metallo-endopeptidase n=1 Tax=Macrococcoides caseolyticum TaxID=69966 RepID=UPI0024BC4628|nr:ImmA/IrrE family metallo-endopeptidase [Macrococcus caseolyticus]MDJ1090686.1 ImmA/IrrE family metallo-endopeptidase [Macrococcus caseolyticus]